MAALPWSDELSVGIQEIDEQHKVLVNLFNELHDAIWHKKGNDAVAHTLKALADYTRTHFMVEESLMRILGYPEYEEHKGDHEKLINQLHELEEKVSAGHHAISFELLHFLRNWLTHHIMEGDRRYAPYFLECGVQRLWKPKSKIAGFWQRILG